MTIDDPKYGNIYYYMGQYGKALEYYKGAKATYQELGMERAQANVDTSIANTYLRLGLYQETIESYRFAQKVFEDKGMRYNLALIWYDQAVAYGNLGQFSKAEELFDRAGRIFEEEGLKNADMIIAAGMDDEKNIVKCIEARENGVEKVIAINNDKAYYDLMHKLGIIVVRGSKIGAYYTILEKIASSSVIMERHFCGGNAVLFMRQIGKESLLIGKQIGNAVLKETFVFVLRDEVIYTDVATLSLTEGDIIMVSGKTKQEEKIQKWIYTL